MIQFTVIGKAKPAGSKRGFVRGGRVVITDTSGQEGREWRAMIQDRAREAMNGRELITGPVRLEVIFQIKRPKAHYLREQVREAFKNTRHTSKPDTTKLLRALEDALTGVVWKDDSQVWHQTASKVYGEYDRTYVCIYEQESHL